MRNNKNNICGAIDLKGVSRFIIDTSSIINLTLDAHFLRDDGKRESIIVASGTLAELREILLKILQNDPEWVHDWVHDTDNSSKKINELSTQVEELTEMVKYIPGGDVFQETKIAFQTLEDHKNMKSN